jgi:hypothetical protein
MFKLAKLHHDFSKSLVQIMNQMPWTPPPLPLFYLFPKPTNKYKEMKIVGHSTLSVSNCINASQSKQSGKGIKVAACYFGPNSPQECLTPYPFSVQPHNIQNKIQRAIRCQGAHIIIAMFIGEQPIG